MKTLYISDLDGTLLGEDDKISDYTRTIINGFLKSGVLFTYATARSLSSASIVTEGLTLSLPVIVYNGVHIAHPHTGERIVQNGFSALDAGAAADFFIKRKQYPLVYSYVDGRECVSWLTGHENEGMLHYLHSRKGDKRLRGVNGTDALFAGEIFYFTLIGSKDELTPIYEYFDRLAPYNTLLQRELYRDEYWCEIIPKGATKANAMLALKEILGCDRTVCFGDGINDLPMFMSADECYAVENAVSQLKAAATGIIGSNREDGVARWLMENI